MSTTVLLIAYRGDRWLPDCLETLADASADPLHLVLVDNAGNTIIDDLDLSAFDAEVLSTPRPLGFAAANNFALAEASHLEDTVLFLNQDTLSRAGWVDRCLDCFEQSPTLGAVSPLLRTFEWTDWDPDFLRFVCAVGQEERLREIEEEDGQNDEKQWFRVKNAPAPALLARTQVLREVGPFDPVFGSYCEDMDLCRRIRGQGYDVGFCTTAEVAHYNGSTTTDRAKERRRMRQILRNRILYQFREGEGPYGSKLARRLIFDFPRRLARGLVGTPSSQPPLVTIQAYVDLLGLGRRILSRRADQEQWEAYLSEIDWPPSGADSDADGAVARSSDTTDGEGHERSAETTMHNTSE